MDFDFSPEQTLLREQTRSFLAKECSPTFVRQMMDDATGYSDRMWRQMGDLGLLGVAIPEAYGGLGLGMVEQSLILEEMGRVVYPGPYFSSVVLAATAIQAGGSEAQKTHYLPAIATGALQGSMALMEDSVAWGPAAVQTRAEWVDGGYRLTGVKRFVPFAHTAHFILIPARTDDGLTIFMVDQATNGTRQTPLTSMDLTSKQTAIDLNGAFVPDACVLGECGNGEAVLEAVMQRAAVAASAEMLGAARKALEMSVDYAKTREQFGQPIGQFQAVKHKLAEMLLEVESAHAAVYYASWALDAQSEDNALAAAVAKAYVSEAARKVCGEAIQVHGGIGFTWEYDLHLYFKRAKHLELLYGDAGYHREKAVATL